MWNWLMNRFALVKHQAANRKCLIWFFFLFYYLNHLLPLLIFIIIYLNNSLLFFFYVLLRECEILLEKWWCLVKRESNKYKNSHFKETFSVFTNIYVYWLFFPLYSSRVLGLHPFSAFSFNGFLLLIRKMSAVFFVVCILFVYINCNSVGLSDTYIYIFPAIIKAL